jgi:hypothetical protein
MTAVLVIRFRKSCFTGQGLYIERKYDLPVLQCEFCTFGLSHDSRML